MYDTSFESWEPTVSEHQHVPYTQLDKTTNIQYNINQLEEWIAEIRPFLTTYSMSVMMKAEAGYVTAQCRHTVTYLKSPTGGRVGVNRFFNGQTV